MHVHILNVELQKDANEQDIIGVFSSYPRIRLLAAADGISSTSSIIEYARDLGRARDDLPELIIWKESIKSFGREIYLTQAVHQESIVVPENIDAIRAMTGLTTSPEESMRLTNESLGLGR